MRAAAARLASARLPVWAAAFGALALLVRLPLFFQRHELAPGGDSDYYLQLAHHLLHGQGVQGEHFYTPGYPAFFALMDVLPGRIEDAAAIAQHLAGVAMVVGILIATWRCFGRAPALLAAAIGALSPVLVAQENTLLPDFFFGALVLAGAVALAEALRRRPANVRLLVVAGVAFGLATWIKPAGQFLLLAAPPVLLFATRDLRGTLRGSAVVALALIVTISPWLARNAIRYGFPSMSNQGGRTLFNRTFDVDGLPIPTDQRYGDLAQQLSLRNQRDPSASQTPGDHPRLNYDFYQALRDRGLSQDDAIAVERRLALIAVRRHPATYLRDTARQLRLVVADLNQFPRSWEGRTELDRVLPYSSTRAWDLARGAYSLWWLLSLGALGSLLALFVGPRDRRNAAAALISVWLAVSVGTVMAHGEDWRYSVQLAPLTWMVGSAGVVILVSSLWARIHQRSPETA